MKYVEITGLLFYNGILKMAFILMVGVGEIGA